MGCTKQNTFNLGYQRYVKTSHTVPLISHAFVHTELRNKNGNKIDWGNGRL